MDGKILASERVKAGLTQTELAEKLGVSGQSVSLWEQGRAKPSIERLVQCSELFGCSTDYLLGRSASRV